MDGEVLAPAGESLLAHPVAVLAVPAFVPVVVIVGTVLWIARKDRREAAAEERRAGGGEEPREGLADEQPADGPVLEPVGAPAPAPRRPWRDRLPRLVIGDED